MIDRALDPSDCFFEGLARARTGGLGGVAERDGGDHLVGLAEPAAQLFDGIEHVTDPQGAEAQ